MGMGLKIGSALHPEGKWMPSLTHSGGGYVELALTKLGVALNRIDTIIDFAAAAKYGVKTEGNHEAATADVLAQLAGLLAAGRLEIPIAKVYPLAQVREAYRELEQRHTRGKIVLKP
jgi:NADPH:quinone reductase-like Zn-dependent oxidoreductase